MAKQPEPDPLSAQRERLRQAGAVSMSGPVYLPERLIWVLPTDHGRWVSEAVALAWLAARQGKPAEDHA